jgi:exonuclease VII small subunit|tara:strand:- start:379 stop:561 length:183 start_codon:yes stop_codon:yes gene_type:complete
MNKKQEELTELFKSFSEGTQKGLYKVVDKLEQRIASLEKVLASHAKCIGEMREDNNDNIN